MGLAHVENVLMGRGVLMRGKELGGRAEYHISGCNTGIWVRGSGQYYGSASEWSLG
jgi:hypothetical protein